MRKRHFVLAAATIGVTLVGLSRQAYATSYASQLKVSGSSVGFDLNENAADVKLVLNNGASIVDLGSENAGFVNTTVTGSPSLVQVVVTTNDPSGYLANNGSNYSSADEIDNPGKNGAPVQFGALAGLAIDTNPSDATFGTIYASNWSTNTNANIPQIGLYVLNPDLTFQGKEAIEQPSGTANAALTSYNAGLTFKGADGPWRLSVGSDGYLYISDWSDATGGIYRAQMSATQGLINGENVLGGVGYPGGTNHADIVSAPVITGSTASGDLNVYAIDSHYADPGGDPTFYNWTVNGTTLTPANGASPPPNGYTGLPKAVNDNNNPNLDTRYWNPEPQEWINFANVQFNLAQGGPGNQFYISQDRTHATEPGLFVQSASDPSTTVWDSWDETERQQHFTGILGSGYDILDAIVTTSVSPDGRFLVAGQYDQGSNLADKPFGVYIIPLLAGIPDLKLLQIPNVGNTYTIQQVAFDAADNFYGNIGGTDNINLTGYGPGGSSVAITSSNGSFTTSGTWGSSASGNLSDTTKWSVGYLPNGSDQALTFGQNGAAVTVNVDASVTEGAITFSSSNGYVLQDGGGTITMNGLGVNFTNQAGNNTIAAQVSIQTDVGFYAAASSSLTISKVSYSGSPDVVMNGPGTVKVSNLNLINGGSTTDPSSGNLDIYAGTLALLPSATAGSNPAVITELTLDTGASLDLGNNDLIYDYNLNSYTTKSPVTVIQGLVASGSIFTSFGGLSKGTGLAVAENDSAYLGVYTVGSVDGQSINPESSTGGTVIVKYTYFGDLNLDGKVDGEDFAMMGDEVTVNGLPIWSSGDLNYDGVVNADDYALFQLGAAMYTASDIQLPEPASLALLGLAAIPMIRCRRV